MTNHLKHTRSALFVDFDNAFRRLGGEAAEAFAKRPHDWLSWLQQLPPPYAGIDGMSGRDILVRRCYLNPNAFGRYRAHFLRVGFDVVDCPSFADQGKKNSADIKMAVDAMALLNHPGVAYDEFIILSADSDFVPLLLKLREWDRRTAILAFGDIYQAYDAASDYVVDQDDFIEQALLGEASNASRAEPIAPKSKEEWFKDHTADLTSFVREIHGLTGVPCHAPEHYKFIFEAIADEVNKNGYIMRETGKAVRDRCNERDIPASRRDINLILRGIFFAGHGFGNQTENPSVLASKFYENSLGLCEKVQLTLSDEEKKMLEQWLSKPSADQRVG